MRKKGGNGRKLRKEQESTDWSKRRCWGEFALGSSGYDGEGSLRELKKGKIFEPQMH